MKRTPYNRIRNGVRGVRYKTDDGRTICLFFGPGNIVHAADALAVTTHGVRYWRNISLYSDTVLGVCRKANLKIKRSMV